MQHLVASRLAALRNRSFSNPASPALSLAALHLAAFRNRKHSLLKASGDVSSRGKACAGRGVHRAGCSTLSYSSLVSSQDMSRQSCCLVVSRGESCFLLAVSFVSLLFFLSSPDAWYGGGSSTIWLKNVS